MFYGDHKIWHATALQKTSHHFVRLDISAALEICSAFLSSLHHSDEVTLQRIVDYFSKEKHQIKKLLLVAFAEVFLGKWPK